MDFEWDILKARANIKKHGVSFAEAKAVFDDPQALLIYDPDHSIDEDRWLLLGMGAKGRLLVVSHCHKSGSAARIISARKATKSEARTYEAANA